MMSPTFSNFKQLQLRFTDDHHGHSRHLLPCYLHFGAGVLALLGISSFLQPMLSTCGVSSNKPWQLRIMRAAML